MWYGHIPVLSSPVSTTFYFQFVNTSGSAADPTSPTYRVYEDNAGSAMLNGSLTKLDTGLPLAGLYYVQLTISSGNGFEDGKYYVIRGSGTIDGETPAGIHSFRCGPEPANMKQIDELATSGNNATLFLKKLDVVNSAGDAIRAESTGGNGRGIFAFGAGSGEGARFVGGSSSASAIHLSGSNGAGAQVQLASSSDAINATASAGGVGLNLNGASGIGGYGLRIQGSTGVTDAPGVFIGGGDGQDAIVIQAGNFSGNAAGIRITGTGTQGAIELQGGGSSGPGLRSTGGAGGSGPGIDLVGGTGGHGVRSTGGSGGSGAAFLGGLNGRGILAQAQSGNAPGFESIGVGTGAGTRMLGGASDGDALQLQAQGTGNAIEAIVVGAEPLSQNIEDQLVNPILAAIAAISPASIASAVWNEAMGTHNTLGSAGYMLQNAFRILRNRFKIDGAANTMTIYQDDELTPLFVWNTKDSLGAPSTSPIFERDPV